MPLAKQKEGCFFFLLAVPLETKLRTQCWLIAASDPSLLNNLMKIVTQSKNPATIFNEPVFK